MEKPEERAVYHRAGRSAFPPRTFLASGTSARRAKLVTDNSTRVTYWEGSVTVSGSMQGQATDGVGYVELTGYVQRVNL
jgi:hypothetical protein